MPRASFIFKKSQENFERKTLRRLIQIKDGHPETVQIWLAFLKRHAYYGVGMKGNVWGYEGLGRLCIFFLIYGWGLDLSSAKGVVWRRAEANKIQMLRRIWMPSWRI